MVLERSPIGNAVRGRAFELRIRRRTVCSDTNMESVWLDVKVTAKRRRRLTVLNVSYTKGAPHKLWYIPMLVRFEIDLWDARASDSPDALF